MDEPGSSSRLAKKSSLWSDLAVRAASGVVMAVVAFTLIWIGGWSFTIMCVILGGLIFWEWFNITRSAISRPAWLTAGFFYALVPVASLWLVRNLHVEPVSYFFDIGRVAFFTIVFTVIATDVGAYFTGRIIGGPKLAPRISPKKTWAGFFGGLISALAVNALLPPQLFKHDFMKAASSPEAMSQLPLYGILVIGSLSIISQVGDLFESWLKRRFDVKDSSKLIPGHGGVMDRLDGLIFVAPVAVLFLYFSK
jgi:phosphatidate cytidylyltransferase